MTKFWERSGEFWDSLTFSLLESAHPRMLYLRLTSYQAMALKLHCGHIIQCTKHYSEIVNETTVTSHIKLRSDIVHFCVYTTHWHHIKPHSMYSLTISLKLHCGELQWYHTLHTALKQNHQNRSTCSTPTYWMCSTTAAHSGRIHCSSTKSSERFFWIICSSIFAFF